MNYCLATVADKNFLIGFEVMLYSFIKNNSWFNKDIVIITNDLKEKDLEKSKLIYPNIKIQKYDASKYKEINEAVAKVRNVKEMYGAYNKYEVFSLDYDRIVFLDSDVIVNDSIKELFVNDFNGNIAMVLEFQLNQFNTGVMVIKKPFLGKAVTNELIENTKRIGPTRHIDQDIINMYFDGKIISIDSYYNFLKHYIRQKGTWINNVKILHFVSKKPWTIDFDYNSDNIGNAECLIIEDYWWNYKNKLEETIGEIQSALSKTKVKK